MANFKNSSIEIFSEKINGWIVFDLNKFHEIIIESGLYEIDHEFNFGNLTKNSNLKIRINESTSGEENNFFSEINQGDFVEVKSQFKLNINLINDSSRSNYQLSVKQTESGKIYNVWRREKVSFKFTESNEVLIFSDLVAGESQNKIKKENVRLLSGSNSDIFNFTEFKFKHLSKEDILKVLSNGIENFHSDFNFCSIFQDILSKFKLENINFSVNDDSSINILTTSKNLLFLTQMIYIKARESVYVNSLENKLKEKEESQQEINRVLERSNKKTYIFPKKFISAIKSKILEKIISADSDLSYLILNPENQSKGNEISLNSPDTEEFKVLLYGNINLDSYDRYFNILEHSIALDPKLADWLKSEKNLEKMNKIVDNSKIVNLNILKLNIFIF
jgi:hypothetical protein